MDLEEESLIRLCLSRRTKFESLMHKKFQMSSMGKLTFFLGLQVMQRDDGIFISQDKYVADILKKFDFSLVKTTSTPIETNKALHKDEEAEDVDVHLYRSMIGSLMYLIASRPDIMFVVCACARFQVTPKVSHLHVGKRIFRYLKGQPKLGLWYPRDLPFDLEAFSDSDYAGDSLDRKSTIRGCQFLGKRLISWQCKKQTVVADSKTEVEYVAATNCCGQIFSQRLLMLAAKVGEGSGQPTDPQYTSTSAQLYNEEPITVLSSSQLKKIHKPRKAERTTKISQSSGPIHLVIDETIYKEWEDRMERAATTASSLEAEQDSSNINSTQSMETLNEPLPQGTGLGSGPRCQVTILGGVEAQTRFEAASKHSNDLPLLRVNTLGSGEDSMKLKELMELYTMVCLPTATINTLDNGEQEVIATVDGHVKIVTIASVRKYLQLAYAGGLSSLPNTEIFDQLSLMGEEIPLFDTILVIDQTGQDTSAQSPITKPHTSSPQLTEPPTSSTIRETIRQEVEIPQSNFPTQTLVVDEAAFTSVDVIHGGAATTVSSIDAGQGSGNITKSPTIPHDSPLLGGHTPGSDVGSMTLHELTVLCTNLSNKVKKLEQTVKTSQARRRTKIIAFDDEDDLVAEDPSKQGRKVTTADAELNTASTFVTTTSPQRYADTTADDLTLAETLMEIRKSAAKAKGKAKMDETESPRNMKQREQGFTDTEWDDVLARVAADEDFVQQLQAGEKCSEEDLPMKLVELVNQRKKFFAQQRAEAKRNKPMTLAQQKEYISMKVQSFVPIGSELEVQRLKRADQEVLEEPVKRQKIGEASSLGEESAEKENKLSKEELRKLLVIVPVEEVYVEALHVKYPIIDWEVYSEDTRRYWKIIRDLVKERFSTTEPTDDKEKELWVELNRLFEPDNDDTLWKLQRYMHDPLVRRLYDICGVHHVSLVRGHEIFMLVEKEYPLTRGLMTVMLANKL
ncbi:putative ribonuclease H-like domain-containing protein [Tanacetum coccineum]